MIARKWKALSLMLAIIFILVIAVGGCTIMIGKGKGKVAVIRLSGVIAGTTQQSGPYPWA